MCAASPARNNRPKRIGSATKLRSGAMLFSIEGPVTRCAAVPGSSRDRSSFQNRVSGHSSTFSLSEHCT